MWLRLQQKQVELRPRIATEPGVQEEVRRNGVETEKNKDNLMVVMILLRMTTYVDS